MLNLESLKWGSVQHPLYLHWERNEKIVLFVPNYTDRRTLISILKGEMGPAEGNVEWLGDPDIGIWRQANEGWQATPSKKVLIQYVENLLKALRKYEQLSIQLAKQFSPAQLGGFMEEMEELENKINEYNAWELEHELKGWKATLQLPDTETEMQDLAHQDQKKVELASVLGAPQFQRILANPFDYLNDNQAAAVKHKLEADSNGWLLLSTSNEPLPLQQMDRTAAIR